MRTARFWMLKAQETCAELSLFRSRRSMVDGASFRSRKNFLSRVTNKINRRNNKSHYFRLRNTIESEHQSFRTHAPVSLLSVAFALRLAHFRVVPLNGHEESLAGCIRRWLATLGWLMQYSSRLRLMFIINN